MTEYINVQEKENWQFLIFKLMLVMYDLLLFSFGWLVLVFIWFCCCCGVFVNTKH